jgi:hypothetical protein
MVAQGSQQLDNRSGIALPARACLAEQVQLRFSAFCDASGH